MKMNQRMLFRLPPIVLGLFLAIFHACDISNGEAEKTDPYNGLRKTYRQDGTLLAEVYYKDSIRDGLARNYYKNGKIQLEMTYVNGVRQGIATSFYENGELYMTTPYVDGQINGIQKKFYKGNILMAEIPFKNSEQEEGMREFSKEGKVLSREAKIIFTLVDNTAFENNFQLIMKLSDNSPHAKFNRYYPAKDGNEAYAYPLTTENGKAVETFFLLPGTSKMEKIHIIAERQTRLGNKQIFKSSYNLGIENKKRHF
jgi:hypothetical protein